MKAKATDLKTKTISELTDELGASVRELFNLRMQKGFNAQQVKPHIFKNVRRRIAQIKTELHQKAKE